MDAEIEAGIWAGMDSGIWAGMAQICPYVYMDNTIFHVLNKVEVEICKNLKCLSPEALT